MTKAAKFLIFGGLLYWAAFRKKGVTGLPVPNTGGGVDSLNTGIPQIDSLPVVTSNVSYSAPADIWIGQSGDKYDQPGGDYFSLAAQLPGGENHFYWYGFSNGNSYPVSGYGANGYIETMWPSHCTTRKAGLSGVVGSIEYKVFRSDGQTLIAYVYDTKGGFLAQNYGTGKRENNHPDFTNRYLPNNETIFIEVTNLSQDSRAVISVRWGEILLDTLNPGQSAVYQKSITDWNALGDTIPKLNLTID